MIEQIINKLNNATDYSMTCFLDDAMLWSDMYEDLDIPSFSFKELQSISKSSSVKELTSDTWESYFDNLRLTIIEFLTKNYTDDLRSHDFNDFEAEQVFEAWIETGSLSEYFEVVYPHLNLLNYNLNKHFGLQEKTNNMREDLLVKYQ